jgi:hypothetical protein
MELAPLDGQSSAPPLSTWYALLDMEQRLSQPCPVLSSPLSVTLLLTILI